MIKNSVIKFLCIVGIGTALILASMLLLENYGPNANKSISPNKEYQVSYNSISKRVTLRNLKTGLVTFDRIHETEMVSFYWSQDSRYLAVVYELSYGMIWSEIRDMDGIAVGPVYYADGFDGAFDIDNTQFKITKFVNDHSVLVECITGQESGGEVSKWYVFDIPNNCVTEVHLSISVESLF